MTFIVCKICGKKISKNALICPHCGYSSAPQTAPILKPCLVCGEELELKKHRWLTTHTYSYISNGNSGVGKAKTIHHKPCTQCGEPKPLRTVCDEFFGNMQSFGATILGKIILIPILFVAIPVLCGYLWGHYYFSGMLGEGYFFGFSLGCVVSVLISGIYFYDYYHPSQTVELDK